MSCRGIAGLVALGWLMSGCSFALAQSNQLFLAIRGIGQKGKEHARAGRAQKAIQNFTVAINLLDVYIRSQSDATKKRKAERQRSRFYFYLARTYQSIKKSKKARYYYEKCLTPKAHPKVRKVASRYLKTLTSLPKRSQKPPIRKRAVVIVMLRVGTGVRFWEFLASDRSAQNIQLTGFLQTQKRTQILLRMLTSKGKFEQNRKAIVLTKSKGKGIEVFTLGVRLNEALQRKCKPARFANSLSMCMLSLFRSNELLARWSDPRTLVLRARRPLSYPRRIPPSPHKAPKRPKSNIPWLWISVGVGAVLTGVLIGVIAYGNSHTLVRIEPKAP